MYPSARRFSDTVLRCDVAISRQAAHIMRDSDIWCGMSYACFEKKGIEDPIFCCGLKAQHGTRWIPYMDNNMK